MREVRGTWRSLLLGLVVALAASRPAAGLTISHLYSLSNFSGPVPYSDVKLYTDRLNDEVYAAVGNSVRVFNATGMEIYTFDHDPAMGTIFDMAVDESGDLLLLTLSFDAPQAGPDWFITRCDYRGRPIGRITVSGLPKEFNALRPNILLYRGGRIVLASLAQFQAVVVDRAGVFQKGYDLARLIGMKESDRSKNDIGGFSIDSRGNMLLTVPTQFRAFIVSPEGVLRSFGRAGSVAGAFGIVAGIVADDNGHVIVADKGRGVVLIFNDKLEFITEFGSEEQGRLGLIRPTDLAVGSGGRLYVTQARDRGVAVFKLEEAPPPIVAPQQGGSAAAGRPLRGRLVATLPKRHDRMVGFDDPVEHGADRDLLVGRPAVPSGDELSRAPDGAVALRRAVQAESSDR